MDNNLYALIISGTPTDTKQLHDAWDNILREYTEAIGTQEFKLYLSLYKEIESLKIDLNRIKSLADILCEIQNYLIVHHYKVDPYIIKSQQSFTKELNTLLRTDCKFNNRDNATYQAELVKCINRSKSLKIKLDLKMMAFAAIKDKNKDGQPMDRKYFTAMMVTISDFAKYGLSENITVSEYCERIKRYTQYCDTLKSKKS